MTNELIIKSIQKINPIAQISISGDDINTIVWENGTPPIPKEQILTIIPQVEFDIAMEDLRAKRNKLLADTDYTVLQDSTYTDAQVAEWVIYRQALRDITEGLTTKEQVEAVVFPTKPE
jgi:hypothetical protein